MFALPSSTSPLRDLFDMADLAKIASPENRGHLPLFREAVVSARQLMAADKRAKAVNTICLCADDTIRLIRVGPKGGIKRIWNFGPI